MKVRMDNPVDPKGEYSSLTRGHEYDVLGIEADWYRILNDDTDPVLFDPDGFRVTDPTEPPFWQSSIGDDGERYAYPLEWNRIGYFEDFHDRIESVQIQFWDDLKRYFPESIVGT